MRHSVVPPIDSGHRSNRHRLSPRAARPHDESGRRRRCGPEGRKGRAGGEGPPKGLGDVFVALLEGEQAVLTSVKEPKSLGVRTLRWTIEK